MFKKFKKAVSGSSMPSGKGHSLQGGSSNSSASNSKSSRRSRDTRAAAAETGDESHGLLARNQPPQKAAKSKQRGGGVAHSQAHDSRAAGDAAAKRLENQKKKTTLQGCGTSDGRKKRAVQILTQDEEGPKVTVFTCPRSGKTFKSFTSLQEHYEFQYNEKLTPEMIGLPAVPTTGSTPTNRANGTRRPSNKTSSPFVAEASSQAGIQAQKRFDEKSKAKKRLADERQKKMKGILFPEEVATSPKSSKPAKSSSSAAPEVDLLTSSTSTSSKASSALVPADDDVLFPTETKSDVDADGIPFHLRMEDTIHQYLSSNPDPKSIKMLCTILRNLLKADSAADQSKFGKVRLSNAKINESIASVPHALEVLEAVGFGHVIINDEPHVVFNFSKEANLQHTSVALGLITSAQ